MTAVNREAIVDAAARAQYEHDRATRGGEGPFEWPDWDDLPVFEQAICRQFVFPVVLATLDALLPLVEGLQLSAEEYAKCGEQSVANGSHEHAAIDHSASAAYYQAAKRVLEVIAP